MMPRRHFLKISLGLSLIQALPLPFQLAYANRRQALFIPPLLTANDNNILTLTIQKSRHHFQKNIETPSFGYNINHLGPTILIARGQKIKIDIQNQLDEHSAIYWHGLNIPAHQNGSLYQTIAPQDRRTIEFTPNQAANTGLYYAHAYQRSGFQMVMGLMGLTIVHDPKEQSLNIPNQWGENDIPLIFQDLKIKNDGMIDYTLDVATANVGYFGNLIATNGLVLPTHRFMQGWTRLRLVNICNARMLKIAFHDHRSFYVIASDGGLLPTPIRMSFIEIFPSERFEIILDLRDAQSVYLISLPTDQPGMTLPPFDNILPIVELIPTDQLHPQSLPNQLTTIPDTPSINGIPRRQLQLGMHPKLNHLGLTTLTKMYGNRILGKLGTHYKGVDYLFNSSNEQNNTDAITNTQTHYEAFTLYQSNNINAQAFDLNLRKPLFTIPSNQYEIWEISAPNDPRLHVLHIQGCHFRILKENGTAVAEHRQGWKDVVMLEGKTSEILVSFDQRLQSQQPYLIQSQIVAYRDTGMIATFTINS